LFRSTLVEEQVSLLKQQLLMFCWMDNKQRKL
jgi:hypothetical protein